MEALAKDKSEDVRRGIAQNLATPATLLEVLAMDTESSVRSAVACNAQTPETLSLSLLEVLAKDKGGYRGEVAENPRTPIAVLEILSSDKNEYIRWRVAENPRTPVSLLEVLATDTEKWVREAVIANPQTPQELRDRIVNAEALFFSNLARLLIASDGDRLDPPSDDAMIALLRGLIGFTAETTNKALTSASRNKDWLMRLGVALHPDASDAQLQLLTMDAEKTVIDVARTKLAARRG
jgi:hypothetical protein